MTVIHRNSFVANERVFWAQNTCIHAYMRLHPESAPALAEGAYSAPPDCLAGWGHGRGKGRKGKEREREGEVGREEGIGPYQYFFFPLRALTMIFRQKTSTVKLTCNRQLKACNIPRPMYFTDIR